MFLKEGINLKNVGKRKRCILALEGLLTFKRAVLVPTDDESRLLLAEKYGIVSVVPLDMILGIDRLPFKISVYMMLNIAKQAINARSYKSLEDKFKEEYNIKLSNDTIKLVVDELGGIVFNYDNLMKEDALQRLKNGVLRPVPRHARFGVLYIEMDGSMFNTCDSINGSTWREIKLGLVYSTVTPNFYNDFSDLDREYISYIGDADTFKAHLFAVAERSGLYRASKIIVIGDGAKWIKGFIDTYCNGLDVQYILDMSHMKSNIFKFSESVIRGKRKQNIWANTVLQLLLEGKIDEALTMTEPFKDIKREGIPNLYNYISNNRNNIDYAAYIEEGYFVGSGKIESANRHVVQERIKRPGMRWTISSAQKLMSLKCKYDSGLWDKLVVPLVFAHYNIKPATIDY